LAAPWKAWNCYGKAATITCATVLQRIGAFRDADILIAPVGKPGLIKGEMGKQGCDSD